MINNPTSRNELMNNMKALGHDFIHNIFSALQMAVSTILVGLLTFLDIFGGVAGALASIGGLVAVIILIKVHKQNLRNARLDEQIKQLEIENLMRRKEDKQPGQPLSES